MLGYTRKQIRSSLVDTLSAITSVGGRLASGDAAVGMGIPNISYSLVRDDYNVNSGIMVSDDNPSERTLSITLEARALLHDGSETPIDDLCLEIEREIASATTLNQLCKDLKLQSTAYEIDGDNKPIGVATLEYNGYYIEYPPSVVTFSSLVVTPASTSCNVTFASNVECKVQLVVMLEGFVCCTTEVESVGSLTHDIDITGLTQKKNYLMFYKVWGESGNGISIITGPEDGDFNNFMPIATNSPAFTTLG